MKFLAFVTKRKELEMNATAIKLSDILPEALSMPREKATKVEEAVGQIVVQKLEKTMA